MLRLTTTSLPLLLSCSLVLFSSNLFSSSVNAQDDSTVSSSQFLSMAAYGDYNDLCPVQTFNAAALQQSFPGSTEAPWNVVEEFGPTASGMQGFTVVIPEMDKVVIVFKGPWGWQNWNATPAVLNDVINIGNGCANTTCTAHQGALTAYLEVKDATSDFAIAQQYVESTGHQFSVTGHASGGMVALIASLDLGYRGIVHWSHSHGAPRTLNPTAANLYNSLFAGEAGQRTVANNDAIVEFIPESQNYTFTLQGFHIYGTNSTYGMNFDICNMATDPNCLGGTVAEDNYFYYTPIGQCGVPNVYNQTMQDAVVNAEIAAYERATANRSTIAPVPDFTASTTTTTTTTTTMAEATTTAASMTTSTISASGANSAATARSTSGSTNVSTSGASQSSSVARTGMLGLLTLLLAFLA